MATTNQSSEDQEQTVKIVLVVDDDAAIGAFILDALQMERPYRALLAPDAMRALETVKIVVPDLFVLDYHLPGINGLELADRLHASETLQHIPILLMSANLPRQVLAERHITSIQKPFDIDELLQTIENLLSSP